MYQPKNSLHLDTLLQHIYDRYVPSRVLSVIRYFRHQISEATLSSISCKAEVGMGYDYLTRVFFYSLYIYRAAINVVECE